MTEPLREGAVESTPVEEGAQQPGEITMLYARARAYYAHSPRLRRAVYQKRFTPAFWTVASTLSLIVNIILIVVLILLGRQLFTLKDLINNQLVGGLYDNFVLMDQAHILSTIEVSSTIQVQDKMPVVFDLPLKQDTTVVLVQDTTIQGATIYLNNYPVPLDIILPAGTPLNISLDLVVPVSQTIPVVLNVPVNLKVPVDIPLEQTQLHQPFVGLKNVVAPYRNLLSGTPDTWEKVPLCRAWWSGWVCSLLFGTK